MYVLQRKGRKITKMDRGCLIVVGIMVRRLFIKTITLKE